jgi:hypothetical protein
MSSYPSKSWRHYGQWDSLLHPTRRQFSDCSPPEMSNPVIGIACWKKARLELPRATISISLRRIAKREITNFRGATYPVVFKLIAEKGRPKSTLFVIFRENSTGKSILMDALDLASNVSFGSDHSFIRVFRHRKST